MGVSRTQTRRAGKTLAALAAQVSPSVPAASLPPLIFRAAFSIFPRRRIRRVHATSRRCFSQTHSISDVSCRPRRHNRQAFYPPRCQSSEALTREQKSETETPCDRLEFLPGRVCSVSFAFSDLYNKKNVSSEASTPGFSENRPTRPRNRLIEGF